MENRYIHTINFPSSLPFAQLFPTKNLKGILNEIVQLFVSLDKKNQLDFKMGQILFCEKKSNLILTRSSQKLTLSNVSNFD